MPLLTLCHVDDISDPGAKGFEVAGLKINGGSLFAVKRDGRIYVYRNACPHLGVELNWLEHQFLDRDETLIQCATHGALFEIETGVCIAGPCRGQQLQVIAHQLLDDKITIDDELPTPD